MAIFEAQGLFLSGRYCLIDTHSYAGDATLTALADRMKKDRTIMGEKTLESSAIEHSSTREMGERPFFLFFRQEERNGPSILGEKKD